MDTWITLTQDDVLASINNPELTAALATATASGQNNPLDTILPDVVAEARGYIRRRNTLGPDGTLPQELKNAAIDMVIYRVANRLRKKALADDRQPDYELALRKLAAVAEGNIAVSAPDTATTEITSAPQPRFENRPRAFGWREEEGV